MNRANCFLGKLLTASLLMGCGSSGKKHEDAPVPVQNANVTGSQNLELWIDRETAAAADARLLQGAQPENARRIQYIADQPMALWLGEWSGDIENRMKHIQTQADATGKIVTLVVYNIPFRDCGSYSAGGSQPSEYLQWVEALTRGLGSQKAMLIVEPDALAQMDCLPEAAQLERMTLLKKAVQILKKAPGAKVYLDGGHPAWKPVDVMAERLLQAGITAADGFALNVSNFQTLEANVSYGQMLRARLGGKTFVIDTSRNGLGPDPQGEWCNPRARALGRIPTLNTGIAGVDAFLWVKRPGESDGACNGGPGAGQWWREMALELAQGAGL